MIAAPSLAQPSTARRAGPVGLLSALCKIAFCVGAFLPCGARAAHELLPVDVRGTWLATDPQDAPHAPTAFDLARVPAGTILVLTEQGSYRTNSSGALTNYMIAVFEGADGFLFPGPTIPVDYVVTLPTEYEGIPTDIPEDFHVARDGTPVEVPAGALRLLFGPADTFFRDNRSHIYKVNIRRHPGQ